MANDILTLGSLFSGIGGFELGFERTGKIKTIWQVEIDEYCRRVLGSHWPAVSRYSDVRECGSRNLPYAEILCGGFPCQDISNAGKRAGIDGERSGLWSEYARIVRELRPRYVVVENVAALLGRGMERILGDLAACGYDAEWQSIRASDVGAPHRRERIWIVAYPGRECRQSGRGLGNVGSAAAERIGKASQRERIWDTLDNSGADVADAIKPGLEGHARDGAGSSERPESQRPTGAEGLRDAETEQWNGRSGLLGQGWRGEFTDTDWWSTEPDVGRVAHGIPARVDRLRGLGNAIVPQIAEFIGHQILAHAFPQTPVTA
jgi:DNA (cytosine-5)-methyltransferase 1